jgi:hypothetical protein
MSSVHPDPSYVNNDKHRALAAMHLRVDPPPVTAIRRPSNQYNAQNLNDLAKAYLNNTGTEADTIAHKEPPTKPREPRYTIDRSNVDGMVFYTVSSSMGNFTISSLRFADVRSELEFLIYKQEIAWRCVPLLSLLVAYLTAMTLFQTESCKATRTN